MTRIAVTVLVLTAAATPAAADHSVRHLPPAEADAGAPLRLSAMVDRGWESELSLRYRPLGSGAWSQAVFTRKERDEYVVTVPGDVVVPPGIEYFIVSTAGGQAAAEFASSDSPHRVVVHQDPVEQRRERYLDRYHRRRAQLRTSAEVVDYGTRVLGGREVPDSYYRIDVDAGYRMLSFPLKALRFGFTHLLGTVPESSRGADGPCANVEPGASCEQEVGFKGGGWFELRFVLRDGIELDARGMVMATQGGFNVGGRGEFRLGVENGTHIAVGTEVIATVGNAGFFRLGWGTVPQFPMAATVEVTNFPATHRATAIRLLYDVSHEFAGGVRIGLRAGYQARDQLVGGVTAGAKASLEF